MNGTREFDWIDFYKELAGKLLDYKDNRDELVSIVRQIFEKVGRNMPTLERDNKLVDIDPFTFFGLFNKSSMTNDYRISVIKAVKEIFGIKASVPTSFSSIPVLNNNNATFYYFIDDRNIGGLPDWGTIYQMISQHKTWADLQRSTPTTLDSTLPPPPKRKWWPF